MHIKTIKKNVSQFAIGQMATVVALVNKGLHQSCGVQPPTVIKEHNGPPAVL